VVSIDWAKTILPGAVWYYVNAFIPIQAVELKANPRSLRGKPYFTRVSKNRAVADSSVRLNSALGRRFSYR